MSQSSRLELRRRPKWAGHAIAQESPKTPKTPKDHRTTRLDKTIKVPNRDTHLRMTSLLTTNQMDSPEVVQRTVKLAEDDATTDNNFVPANIIEMLSQTPQS